MEEIKEQAPQEKEPEPKPQKNYHFTRKTLGIFCLMTVIIIFLGYYFISNESSRKTAYAPTPTASPTKEMSNWKTYVDTDSTYSIKYPPDWAVTLSESPANYPGYHKGLKDFAVEGKEGKVLIWWTGNYGGACEDWQKMAIGGRDVNVCVQKDVSDKGEMSWEFEGIELNKTNHQGILPFAIAKSPWEKNRTRILQILSTLKFTNSNQAAGIEPSETTGTTETINYVLRPWSTYADNPAAYEVRFPMDTQRAASSEIGKNLIIQDCGGAYCSTIYSVGIYNDYDGGSRRDWLQSKLSEGTLVNPYYQDLIVQGVKALLIMNGDTGSYSSSYVVIPRGPRVYLFTFASGWNPATGEKPGLDFIKQVLSTFKLL